MKHWLFLLMSTAALAVTTKAFAQCTGCNMDNAYTSPGIYPNPLPNGTQGTPYDEDVTFVMFTDTSGLSVNYFKIVSVGGLPFGLNWECNAAANGCQYNPQESIYGCVKICGTPLQFGEFVVHVNVDVNLELIGTQQSTVDIPISIQPASGGNNGFTFTPTSGCDSLLVDFTALVTGPGLASYVWDFGDGETATNANEQHHYLTEGEFVVSLQTTLSEYAMSALNVASMNENWCGDVEEPNLPFVGCTGSPDPYFVLTDASGNTVYTSGNIDNVSSATWNDLTVTLNNPPYSVALFDDDPTSVDDNLGTFSFSPSGTDLITLSGAGGTAINISIGLQTVAEFSDADTVYVWSSPDAPSISFAGNDSICPGAQTVLSLDYDSSLAYQWFHESTPVTGADSDSLLASTGGEYTAVATNAGGCSAESSVALVTEMLPLPNITFNVSGSALTTFLTSYDLQWYMDGAAIAGATAASHEFNASGFYSLRACDALGCCRFSDSLFITFSSLSQEHHLNYVDIAYDPATKALTLEATAAGDPVSTIVYDALGRTLYSLTLSPGERHVFATKHLSAGLYFIRFASRGASGLRTFSVSR